MKRPATRYANSGGGYVAWQEFGEPSKDILFVSSWATNVDAMWDEPSCALFFGRLARIGRVICFDKRVATTVTAIGVRQPYRVAGSRRPPGRIA